MSPVLFGILCIGFLLNSHAIWWGLPLQGSVSWAPDEIFPATVLKGMNCFFSSGWHERYPPLHYYFLSIIYLPFVLLHSAGWVDLFSQKTITLMYICGRFISVIMGTATIYLVYRCNRELFDRRAGLYAALIATLICPVSYYAKIINLEVPYTFWFVLSLNCFIPVLQYHRLRDYLAFSCCAVLSVCTKDQAYGLYVGVPVILIFIYLKSFHDDGKDGSIRRKMILQNGILSLVAAVLLFLVIHNAAFNFSGLVKHFQVITGAASQNYRMYANTPQDQLRMAWQTLHHVVFSLGWPFSIMCFLGFLIPRFRTKQDVILIVMAIFPVTYYFSYIAVVGYTYLRYVIPMSMVLAMFGGRFLSFLHSHEKKATTLLMHVLLVCIAAGYTYKNFIVSDMMHHDSRYAAEAWIQKNIPVSASIMGIGMINSLPRMHPDYPFYQIKIFPSIIYQSGDRPEYLITTSLYGSERLKKFHYEALAFKRLENNETDYQEVFSYRYVPFLNILDIRDIISNLDKINPMIKIYRRSPADKATDKTLSFENRQDFSRGINHLDGFGLSSGA
ncbi:MAG: ArnT family glycosyltransferase [Desulfatirhabdiaceae bacterium]